MWPLAQADRLARMERKNKLLQVRIDEKTLEKLDYCAERLNLNRSDVVRSGIQLVSKQLDK